MIAVILVSIITGSTGICYAGVVGSSANDISDIDYCSDDLLMDENVEQTIALLFVMCSMDSNAWDERTTIKDTIPLYSLEGQVNAYCIVLKSGNRDCGYIIVSAKGNTSIIQEYSDASQPLFYEGHIDSEYDNNRVLYLGPLNYESIEITQLSLPDENNIHNSEDIIFEDEDFYALIRYIRRTGMITTENRYLSDPLVWLQSLYSTNDFYHVGSYSIPDYAIPSYTINNSLYPGGACSIYGVSCILKYYLGNSYTFASVLSTCVSVAQTGWYANYNNGSWNYYIQLGSLQPFAQDCVDQYGLNIYVYSSYPFSWTTGVNEISNNRPFLYNVAYSLEYEDHTVTSYGYDWYYITLTNSNMRFYKVRDGYTANESRYISVDYVTGAFGTRFVPGI